ncbi:MAG: oligosaccharide flippase family protein, partial [Alloprevotella sp.]|nr:oligosaccharide flippase family protein [Alloprevotella sp.]
MSSLKEKIQQHPLVQRINKSDIGHRMASGASWSFTGTALAKFIVLVAGIACAHVLGKHEYGQFGMVRSTISLFVVFGFAGMGLTATKFISEYKKDHKERIPSIYLLTNGFAILTGLLVAIAILFLAPTIADRTLNAPELVVPLRVGALLLFVTVINGAQQGTLAGFENFKAIALNTLIGSIAESVLMLIGGYYWGVTGAVLGFGSGFIVLYVANNISIRKNFLSYGLERRLSLFDKKDLHLLYKFSLPAMLSSLMVAPGFWI